MSKYFCKIKISKLAIVGIVVFLGVMFLRTKMLTRERRAMALIT